MRPAPTPWQIMAVFTKKKRLPEKQGVVENRTRPVQVSSFALFCSNFASGFTNQEEWQRHQTTAGGN